MKILIPALERQERYDDLSLLIRSIHCYAGALPVYVAWKGKYPPFFYNVVNVEQQAANACFGAACRDLLRAVDEADEDDDDDFLWFINDDCVLTPHTVGALRADLATLDEAQVKLGLLGLRSNFIAGPQNIRIPVPGDQWAFPGFASERLLRQTPTIKGVSFVVSRATLKTIPADWTNLHWYSDDLLSYDLTKGGHLHFISTAYIHHHGSRSGGDYSAWDAEAKQWLATNRPDFFSTL